MVDLGVHKNIVHQLNSSFLIVKMSWLLPQSVFWFESFFPCAKHSMPFMHKNYILTETVIL